MTIQRFVTVLFLCVSAQASSLALTSHAQAPQKKIYVSSQNVKVTPKGLVVTASNHRFTFKAIRADRNGLFVLRKDLISSAKILPRIKGSFQCDRCSNNYDHGVDLAEHYLERHAGK
jgi:hypothetical protein